MTQTAATVAKSTSDALDYTPSANVTSGQVVIVGGLPYVAREAIAANVAGTIHPVGSCQFDLPKDNSVFTAESPVFWDASLTDVGGTNTGAANNATGLYMGTCVAAAANTATTVRVAGVLAPSPASRAVNAAGGNIATATPVGAGMTVVGAADNSTGVILPSVAAGICIECVLVNRNTDKTLKVYPPLGAQISGAGANNAVTLAANGTGVFRSTGNTGYEGSLASGIVA